MILPLQDANSLITGAAELMTVAALDRLIPTGRMRKAAVRLLRRLPGTVALGLARYWRDLDMIAEADVVFVSFPKSGRTFVRTKLARLYQHQFGIDERELLSFDALRRSPPEVPRIVFTHGGDAMRKPDQISFDFKVFEGRKIVVLARHPGDVAVSRYFHLKHRSNNRGRQKLASQPLEEFVWTERGGIPSITRYLNLWAHWSRVRGDILFLRYEDFVDRPEPTLRALAEFIGLASNDAAIHDAIEFASFDNLRAKEREGYFSSGRMGARRVGDESSYKVRAGRSGGFRAKLAAAGCERVKAYVRENLDPSFGYTE